MERHAYAYKSQWYILNLSMWFWQWTCMSVTSVTLSEFIELNSMIHKQTYLMYEKNVLNSYHFLHYTHPKFYTQKFAMHPDKTSELLSTKLNLNLVYSLYSFSLISLRKYENFQKVISAGFLDVNQRLPVSFVCVNRNSRFYNRDIDL